MSHILVVDDEPRMCATLERGLNQADYEVSIITDGLIAYKTDIRDYDLVILDWMLPGMEGIEILRHWRRQNILTPVLMLTAKGQLSDKVEGLNFGADDYLSKFFEWPELLARIHALLRRSKNKEQKVGNITFDRQAQTFLEHDKPVGLTSKEYQILKYFFDRPGRLLSKSALVQSVYKDDYNNLSNVIERHIHSIRCKFDYDPIQTIRGLGYRLNAVTSVPTGKN